MAMLVVPASGKVPVCARLGVVIPVGDALAAGSDAVAPGSGVGGGAPAVANGAVVDSTTVVGTREGPGERVAAGGDAVRAIGMVAWAVGEVAGIVGSIGVAVGPGDGFVATAVGGLGGGE